MTEIEVHHSGPGPGVDEDRAIGENSESRIVGVSDDEDPGLRSLLEVLPRESFKVLKKLELPVEVLEDLLEALPHHVEVPEADHDEVVDIGEHEPKSEKRIEEQTVDDKMLDRPHRIDEAPLLLVLIDHVCDVVRSPRWDEVLFSVERFDDGVFLVEVVGALVLMTVLDGDPFRRSVGRHTIREAELVGVFFEVGQELLL